MLSSILCVRQGDIAVYTHTNSIDVVMLSPGQAGEFLRYRYMHDRPLRQWYVDALVKEMREGRFQFTAEVHIAYVNGQPNMINGKHTCNAIVKFGKPVRVTLRKTYTSEPGQIAALYALGHDNQLRRLFSDQMGAYGLGEETGLTRNQLDALASALRAMRYGFRIDHQGRNEASSIAPVDMMKIVREWAVYMRDFDKIIMPCPPALLRTVHSKSVLAIGLITVRYQRRKAQEFWSAIARPDELKYVDPRAQARQVIDRVPNLRRANIEIGRVPGKIARCWNAFMSGRTLEVVQPFPDGAPMVIEGTPWNGKQPVNMLPNDLNSTEVIWY